MESKQAQPRDILQVLPGAARWGSLLFVVSEVRSWGVIAYMRLPGRCEGIVAATEDGAVWGAWVRLKWDEFVLTGGQVTPEPPII